jgi:hypothetical protein
MRDRLAKSRSLAAALALSVAGALAARAELRAAWEFNASDVSGASVSASAGSAANTTGALVADASANAGYLALGASTNYLAFGTDVTGLRGLSAMTICAWVRTGDGVTTMRRIVEHDDNFYFYQDGGKYRFVIHGTGGATLISTTAPASNVWQHVAAVWQLNNTAKIYVNGVLEHTVNNPTVAMQNNAQRLSFGAQRNNGATPTLSAFYRGDLDDVAVWNEILPQERIEALAGRSLGGYSGRVAPTALSDFVVTHLATGESKSEATLNGMLVSTGGVPASVTVYWGAADGATDAGAWANTNHFGARAPGLLCTNLTGLAAGSTYFYRFYAENADGGRWASASRSFTTARYLPTDFAGLQLWLRPDAGVYSDAGTTPAGSGDTVTQWNDHSGNGRNAARVGSSGQLILEGAALGGKPGIRMSDGDGSSYLEIASYVIGDAADLTVFVVSRALPQTLNGSAIHPLVGSGSPYQGSGVFTVSTTRPNLGGAANLGYFGRGYPSSTPYSEYTSTNGTPNFGDGLGHVIALQLDAAAVGGKGRFSGYYDGRAKESHDGTTTNPTNGPLEIGGSAYATSARYAGVFGDILIYNRVLNADEHNKVGWYLQDKYGLEGAYRNPYAAWLTNTAATAVRETSATLNATLLDGDLPAAVTVYWGPSDGGTGSGWAFTNTFGEVGALGELVTNVTGLASGTTYFYRFFGSNSQGGTWSGATRSFTTWREQPDDIADLQLWLKADEAVYCDAGATPATNGAVVAQWNDHSSHARDAARSGTLGNLTYVRDALGGMPAIRLTDASGGDYLQTATYQVADTDDLTVFVVSKSAPQTVNGSAIHPLVGSGNPSSGGGAFCISTMRPNAGGSGYLGYFGRGYNPYPYDEYTKTNQTPNFSDGVGHVIELRLTGASTGGAGTFSGYYDGALKEVHNGVTANPANGPVEIGGSASGIDRRYAGAFGDILIYNRALTDKERSRVGWYLQTKYGIAASYANPFACVLTNAAATDVHQTSATCNAELLDGDVPAEVTLYWGTADGGADAGAWANTNALGAVATLGAVSAGLTGLTPGTIYYYRYHASNSQGGVWTDTTVVFNTDGPPVISTGIPNALTFTSATLEGTLVATSGAPTQVWIYWGTADGGTDPGQWATPVELGTLETGLVGTPVIGLSADTTYHYRLYAENSYGGRWASESVSFKTPFAPNIKTDGLVLWLRADAGVAHSGGFVDAWQDQAADVGGTNSATGTGASRPEWVLEGFGGRPAVRFDGTDDFLTVPDHDALDLGTGAGKGWTLFAVYRRDDTATLFKDIVAKTGGASNTTDWRFFTQSGSLLWGTGTSADTVAWMSVTEPAAVVPHIIAGTVRQTGETSGSKVLYVDGAPVASGNYTAKAPANAANVTLGGSTASTGNLQGLIAEVLVFNRELSDDNLNNVGFYLQEKYGLSGAFEYRAPRGTLITVR